MAKLALISLVPQVTFAEVARVAAAIQQQVTHHLDFFWHVGGTVSAFPTVASVPEGYWKVFIAPDNPSDNILGAHATENSEPFAGVEFAGNWTMTTSHECLEMLVDPKGEKFFRAASIESGQPAVDYLAEICDPCQVVGYWIDDVLVSDFYTPAYFDATAKADGRYSMTGSITQPRQVLPGGYLSWKRPLTEQWRQAINVEGVLKFRPVNPPTDFQRSARSRIDAVSRDVNLSRLSIASERLRESEARQKVYGQRQVEYWRKRLNMPDLV